MIRVQAARALPIFARKSEWNAKDVIHMNGHETGVNENTSALMGSLNAALMGVDETQRYRLLADLLAGLADRSASSDGTGRVPAEQVKALKEKIAALDFERARAVDELKTARDDLDLSRKQLDDERTRSEQRKQDLDKERARSDAMRKELEDVRAEIVAKNNALHRSEVTIEELTLKSQRAEQAGQDRSRVDELECQKNELIRELESVRAQNEALRADKNQELAQLDERLRESKASASAGGDALLAKLWEPLAAAKPPVADGHVPPTQQSAERLIASFVELAHFLDRFDRAMRPFLTRYTKHFPSVRVPWEAYAKGDDLLKVVHRTIAPVGGRPVGVLKGRLRYLFEWTHAAMFGCDSAIESIAFELETFIRGENGFGGDPNRKLKDFVRDDGHELFMQHMREIRGTKLADAFGRGG